MKIEHEITVCNACHSESIRSNGDAAICTNCGTPEDYITITKYTDGKLEISQRVIDNEMVSKALQL